MGDERHDGGFGRVASDCGAIRLGQEIFNAERLSGKDAVERGEAEFTLATDKVGEMRCLKARLAGEKGAGELPAINTASYLDAELLVELREIHLWNFV